MSMDEGSLQGTEIIQKHLHHEEAHSTWVMAPQTLQPQICCAAYKPFYSPNMSYPRTVTPLYTVGEGSSRILCSGMTVVSLLFIARESPFPSWRKHSFVGNAVISENIPYHVGTHPTWPQSTLQSRPRN